MLSCNGLFLCSSLMTRELDTSYYVCNPTTKNFSTLPKLEDGSGSYKGIVGMTLAFDPAKSSHYRVICNRGFVMDSDEYYYQIEMYSSEIGSWRVCGEPFTEGVNFEKPAYWNGAIHWINYGRGDSLYFSIDDQVIETMPMPPFPDGWDWRGDYYFGESSGHLHYINISSQNIQLDVYELKRDYSEWFVKYQIDLSPVLNSHPRAIRDPENWDISIFCLVCGKEQEDSFLIFPIPGKFIRYYLGHNSFETFYEFVDDEVEYSWFWRKTGIQYIESLSCV